MDDTNTNQPPVTAPLTNPTQDASKGTKWKAFIKGAITGAVITGGIRYAAKAGVGFAGFAGPLGIALAMGTSAIALTGIDVFKDYRAAKQTMKTKEALKSLIAKDKLKKYGLKFAFNLASSAVGAAAFLGAEALIEHTVAGAWVKDTIVGLMPSLSGATDILSSDSTTTTIENTETEALFIEEPANVVINPPVVEAPKPPLVEESGHFLDRLNADLETPKEPEVIQGGQTMVIQPVAETTITTPIIEKETIVIETPNLSDTVDTSVEDTPALFRMIGDWIDEYNAPDVADNTDNNADTITDTVETIDEPENDIIEAIPEVSTLDKIADILKSTDNIGQEALDTLKLAENGDARAVKDLAVYFFNGTDALPQDMRGGFEGISKNTDLAIELYKQAAEAGYKPAQADLNYIEKVLGFSLEPTEVLPTEAVEVIETPVDTVDIVEDDVEITTPVDAVVETDIEETETQGMAASLLNSFNNFMDDFMTSSEDILPANDAPVSNVDTAIAEPELGIQDPPDAGVAVPLLTLDNVAELFSSTDNIGQEALNTLNLAQEGDARAIKDLAVYFFNGTDALPQDMRSGFEGIEKNREIAIELYKQAADLNYAPAQADLDYIESRGWLPETTDTANISNIIEDAKENISDIADINTLSATDQLIQDMSKQDLSPQAQKILDGMVAGKSWAIESAGIGILNGQFGLPTMPEDFAIELIQQAADSGNENALLNMAYFQYHGLHGVDLDREKAIEIIKEIGRPWVGGDEVFYMNTSGVMNVKEGGIEVALCQVFENSNDVDCSVNAEEMHANDYLTVNMPDGGVVPIYLEDGARTHNTQDFMAKRMVEVLNTQPPIKTALKM